MERPALELTEVLEEDGDERSNIFRSLLCRALKPYSIQLWKMLQDEHVRQIRRNPRMRSQHQLAGR